MWHPAFDTAVYIRLSREDGDKEESDSVGNQRKLLTQYVSNHGDLVLHDIYIDDGYSGTNFNRPSFQRMIADVEDGKVNCVVVKDLSRFGRDYIDTGRYLERIFPELEVRFISITDGIDSLKQSYDMLLPIKNIFNEQYARDISKKIQTAVKTKQRAGEFIGAFASYGYKKSPANKNKLVIDAYAADVVRRIFSLYIQGYGKQRIAKLLNEEGILCPAEYKKVNGENYHNSNRLESTVYWSYTTINSILRREIYTGNMVQGTKHQRMRSRQKAVAKEDWIIVENTHEAIIDKDTWEKAQLLLSKRTRNLDFHTNRNIFAGFLKCGDCGRAMAKHVWHLADGSKVDTLSCGTYKRHGTRFCTPHTISLKVLEEIVLSDLKVIVQNIRDLQELVRQHDLATSRAKQIDDTEPNKIASELERVKKRKQSVYEDYKDGLISKEEFLSYREEYLKKEVLYTKQMEAASKRLEDQTAEDDFQTPWMRRLLELRDVEKLDREIVVDMVSEILVYENRRIRIRYNFSDELQHLFSQAYHPD
ncbi:MAG: recombinase family protein [Eubacteriales bacterium]|nr:recombinase family protein [Eubacteriales bacterium]